MSRRSVVRAPSALTPTSPGATSATDDAQGPIEPGEYAMLCPIVTEEGPHWELGQLEEFSIE